MVKKVSDPLPPLIFRTPHFSNQPAYLRPSVESGSWAYLKLWTKSTLSSVKHESRFLLTQNMIQNISQWNPTLKELKSLVASQRIRTFLQLETFCDLTLFFRVICQKGGLCDLYATGPFPLVAPRADAWGLWEKIYISNTQHWRERNVCYIQK